MTKTIMALSAIFLIASCKPGPDKCEWVERVSIAQCDSESYPLCEGGKSYLVCLDPDGKLIEKFELTGMSCETVDIGQPYPLLNVEDCIGEMEDYGI